MDFILTVITSGVVAMIVSIFTNAANDAAQIHWRKKIDGLLETLQRASASQTAILESMTHSVRDFLDSAKGFNAVWKESGDLVQGQISSLDANHKATSDFVLALNTKLEKLGEVVGMLEKQPRPVPTKKKK